MTDDTKRAIEAAKDLLDGWFHASVSGEEMDRLMHVLRTALSALDRPTEQGHESDCALLTDPERGECDCRPVSNSAEEVCPGSIHGEHGAIPCVCVGIQALVDAERKRWQACFWQDGNGKWAVNMTTANRLLSPGPHTTKHREMNKWNQD